jgi:hypothetical protein
MAEKCAAAKHLVLDNVRIVTTVRSSTRPPPTARAPAHFFSALVIPDEIADREDIPEVNHSHPIAVIGFPKSTNDMDALARVLCPVRLKLLTTVFVSERETI